MPALADEAAPLNGFAPAPMAIEEEVAATVNAAESV